MRNSFIFYGSWWEALVNLPRDVRGDVLTAIVEYGLSGETTGQLKPIAKALLALVKPQIDANSQRYENGLKGGRPSQAVTEPKPNRNQTETEPKPNGNQPVTEPKPNDNDNYNYLKKEHSLKRECKKESRSAAARATPRAPSIPPALEEVREYCAARGNGLDAERIFDYYEANGWVQGRGKPIRDWRAAVRTWERNGIENHTEHAGNREDIDRRRGTDAVIAGPEAYEGDF